MTRAPLSALLVASLTLATACPPDDSKPLDDTGFGIIDEDGDGYSSDSDCDDGDPAIHPGADEVCDEADNDCDGEVDEDVAFPWYPDADGDGYGDGERAVDSCEQPSGYVDVDGDCDDDDAASHPGADERCDGADNDCDGEIDEDPLDLWYVDADGDGYGNSDYVINDCDPGSGWVSDATDCDDTDDAIHPEAAEVCNGLDDDCDDEIDEELDQTWYLDSDGDGFGEAATSVVDCGPGSGWVLDSGDCDDAVASVNPDAEEACNGIDDDCDGLLDDADPDILGQTTWYLDSDGDGYGIDGTTAVACFQPSGYALYDGDCDDGDAAFNPGASETDCTDPADYNCDGSTGYADLDADGWAACEDCDDSDATVFPGADEHCDGVDDDCDGTVDEDDAVDAGTWCSDDDGDGYGDAADCTTTCTQPVGSVESGLATDCDDGAATVHPGATESCDGVDQDCDGLIDDDDPDIGGQPTWYTDSDGDGYGDASLATLACAQPSGTVADASDCDDGDATVNPGAVEACNGIDDDCDALVDDDDSPVSGTSTWHLDYDGDGFGGTTVTAEACDAPSGYVATDTDCDDLDADVFPGADERCDGVDDDCDGTVDEDDAIDASTWYLDYDGDGYGDVSAPTTACDQPSVHVADATDCDDADAAVNPGEDEQCNGVDDDCDGTIDEDSAADVATWYADVDGDGYGDPGSADLDCDQPTGFVADDSDCDDAAAAVNPGATELCDGVDNDCDGTVDEGDAADASTWYFDADVDGYGAAGSATTACSEPTGYVADDSDCDDHDDDINPGATELCDGVDNDCDGTVDEGDAADASTWYFDADVDGYGAAGSATTACAQPSGYIADGSDCDDHDDDINPGATELCNGFDDDCDGSSDEDDAADAPTWYADVDGDGYGDPGATTRACSQPSGYQADASDCDDASAAISPAATELCDGVDNDCDGSTDEDSAADAATWYADADADGFGDPSSSAAACSQPVGHVADATDCDDHDDDINPGATELCNGVDDDCDGSTDEDSAADAATWYADGDSDGYGFLASTEISCDQPAGYVALSTDCDDGDSTVHPGATELCNSVDDDCDGLVDDADSGVVGGLTWHPDADGDGYGSTSAAATACVAPSGYLSDASDCDDGDSTVHPGATELCNGVDDDCDGLTDDDDGDLSEWSTWYLDADGDGYGDATDSMESCAQPTGYVADASDCDDDDPSIYECHCGDGYLHPGEEVDPDPGYSYISLDSSCRWDFSGINQLYCNGSCTWAGSSDCDQSDANILCQLLMDNPASTAVSWTSTTALSEPGFSCPGYGGTISTDRGVSVSVWYQDSSILATHGPGNVIAYPVCTDP